MVVWFGGIPSH